MIEGYCLASRAEARHPAPFHFVTPVSLSLLSLIPSASGIRVYVGASRPFRRRGRSKLEVREAVARMVGRLRTLDIAGRPERGAECRWS